MTTAYDTHGFLPANNNIYETHRDVRSAPGACHLVDKVSLLVLSFLKEYVMLYNRTLFLVFLPYNSLRAQTNEEIERDLVINAPPAPQ